MNNDNVLIEQEESGTVKSEKLWTVPYITLISLGTFVGISFYMVMPLLTKYAIKLGSSLPIAGVIVGMFSFVALFARPVSGIISDRLNKKVVFIVSTALIGLSLLGYTISTNVTVLIFFRVTHALAFSVNGIVNLALVSKFIPRKRIGEGIGYFGLGQIIATAVGPTLGLYIGEKYGLSVSFLIAGIIMICVSALMFALPNTKHKKESCEKQKRRICFSDFIAMNVLPYAFFGAVFSMLNGVIGSYLVLLGDERGIKNISLYFTVNAISLILVRTFAGKIYDKYGISTVIIPSFILALVASMFIGYAQTLAIILVASALKAFAQGSGQPTIQAECIKMLPEEKSGVATSTYYIGADLGQGIGPMLAGVIASTWNYKIMFVACAGVFLVSLILYLLFQHKKNFSLQQKI
ncbi:MFS transporter [Ruminiclostridium papyrosolvens]|uniref:Major facilitator superfamily (MFS) profile domain-containing protein n=1 Tax=Ruminiclostridium papyrosolvens C7 TaxID=1330534 RepID=U4R192_9FIRM|nr:MFS transporter [Ruminiclostridium papyrosolvens]EPR10543.1 hypothetical protein L323_13210 [Ruminiclostridium papyrosolvens C7]